MRARAPASPNRAESAPRIVAWIAAMSASVGVRPVPMAQTGS